MSDFQTSLIQERDELDARLTKLKAFLEAEAFLTRCNIQQQVLLYSQSGLMQVYLNTLKKRIELRGA